MSDSLSGIAERRARRRLKARAAAHAGGGKASPRRRLQDAERRAESLRHVIESISGELALGPLLTRIVESAVRLLDAADGSIGLVVDRPDGPVIRTAATHNMPPRELGSEMPPGRAWRGVSCKSNVRSGSIGTATSTGRCSPSCTSTR